MQDNRQSLLQSFSQTLIGLPVAHVWRGHGSALFLEFGLLRQHVLDDGRVGRPVGQMGLMIQWSWRIEDSSSILCGSWSDAKKWPVTFERLLNAQVTEVSVFGRLPEIDIGLSNRLHVVSFSTTEGQPQWALFCREIGTTLLCRNGTLEVEAASPSGHSTVLH